MAFKVKKTKTAQLNIKNAYLWLKKRNYTYADEMNTAATRKSKGKRQKVGLVRL